MSTYCKIILLRWFCLPGVVAHKPLLLFGGQNWHLQAFPLCKAALEFDFLHCLSYDASNPLYMFASVFWCVEETQNVDSTCVLHQQAATSLDLAKDAGACTLKRLHFHLLCLIEHKKAVHTHWQHFGIRIKQCLHNCYLSIVETQVFWYSHWPHRE